MTQSDDSGAHPCAHWPLSSKGRAAKPGASPCGPGAGRAHQRPAVVTRGQPCAPGAGRAHRGPAVCTRPASQERPLLSAGCQGRRQRGHLCHASRHPPEGPKFRHRLVKLALKVGAVPTRGFGEHEHGAAAAPELPSGSFSLVKLGEGLGELRTVWVAPINRLSI